jgi:hypothetical protein
MTYAEFVNLVERLWDEIPEAFKKGLQGVHVLPKAKPEPGLKGVWRLGEYLDPGPPSAFRGFEGLGRHIALYYGSFLQVAGPGFDKKSFRSLPSSKSTRLAKRLSERPRLYLPLLRGRKQEDFI